jgi:hypothetical protein
MKDGTLDYLTKKHRTLINSYKTPDGRYSKHCGMIALEVGQRLLEEGKIPKIRMIRLTIDSPRHIRRTGLIPRVFKDRWYEGGGSHQVCCESELAYDPLLIKPVKVTDYSILMFGENLPLELMWDTEDIRKLTQNLPNQERPIANFKNRCEVKK